MSTSLPITLIASLLAGGAGAVAAVTLTSSSSEPVEAQSSDVDTAAVLDRLTAIEARMDSNAMRIEELASKPQLVPVSDGSSRMGAAAGDTGLSKEDILAMIKETATEELSAPTSVAAATVEAVIEQREERERQEREVRRAEEREKRIEDRLAKMQSELGLDMNQMNGMRDVYATRDTKMNEMRDAMRQGWQTGGMDRTKMREMWGELSTETSTAIQGVLTPSQYEQYQEGGYDDFGGGRGGGRGRGGNAGGDNGGGNNGGGGRGRGGF